MMRHSKKPKSFKKLVKNFDTNNPDFTGLLPYLTKETEVDLEDFTGDLVGKWNAIKTMWKINQPKKLSEPDGSLSRRPKSRSRVWSSPRGYRFLVQWSNASLLRILIRKFTKTLPRSEHRTKTQLDDAARSVVSCIVEGYRRPTTSQYLEYLGFSEGSLEEIHDDINKCLQDKFLKSVNGSSLKDLGIDLKQWNNWAKNPTNSSKILSFPLKENKGNYRTLREIKGQDLTYQLFIELINKTDYLLRKLVESLEKKLDDEQMGYKVERSRIKGKLKKK